MNGWNGGLLSSSDGGSLDNQDRLAVFLMMTCLNGYFQDASSDSLSEVLLKAGHGGAIAVWGSSGMTLPEAQAAMNEEFYRLVFSRGGDESLSLGEAIQKAKSTINDRDVRRSWILLGDPTMRVNR
jgi:hypothetical protein